ncbi:MAG: serine/threonine-protein kinase, partial [Pirellulales bacterium]
PYHIIDSIGQGGMGQVFKAEHSLMGRVVAIKVLPKNKSTPETIAGFSQEIRAQAQLDHDNLVRAYDAGHDGNVYYLVCEYVPGCDLRQLVKAKGKLSQREAATIISQAAAGLAHAHEIGLVHRDAKPGNILVTPEGKTKVSDLGLAGFLHGDETDARRGKIVGTADYLAPEQIINPLVVQPVSDIYSLGCSMYFAITGNVPYPGGTTRDKCHRHCNDTPLNPRRFNPNLSDDFLDVLADMMAKEPGERIATAMEVCQRLERWADLAVTNPLPVRERSWARPPLPPLPAADEQDSQPTFADYPADREQDAPSQASQRTDPVSQDMQDTKPGIDRPQPRRRPPRTQPPRLPEPSQPAGGDGEWLLWVAAALAVLALAAGGGVALLTWLW